MAKGTPTDSALRSQILQYATNLRTLLAERVGVITGRSTLRCTYQERTVETFDPKMFTDWVPACPEPSTVDATLEVELVNQWQSVNGAKPMIIIAPVGSGKSCLLESLALRLADNLLSQWHEGQPLQSVVPLLIPLSWVAQSGSSLEEYLLNKAEATLMSRAVPSKAVSLNPETVEFLLEQNRILALIDGFDEIGPAHREVFADQISQLRIFVLASRPGFGAEFIPSAGARIRTLTGFRGSQPKKFVKEYFTHLATSERPERALARALKLLAESTSSPIGYQLATCPLYLRAWCEAVHRSPSGRPPQSLGALGKQLVRSCVERRKLFKELRTADQYETGEYGRALALFSDWLGRLGRYFADRGFAEQTLEDPEGRIICAAAYVKFGDATYNLMDVAIDSGLLIKSNNEFHLPTVPVVEYCIGKYLADDAASTCDAPKVLIDTFRRWICRPVLHDILDYTFDELWNDNRRRHWASDLLEWAANVTRHNVAHAENMPRSIRENLLRPFLMTAMRWLILGTEVSASELALCERCAKDIGVALAEAVRYGCEFIATSLHLPRLPMRLVFPLIDGLIEQYVASGDCERSYSNWFRLIGQAGYRVRETEVESFVKEIIVRCGEVATVGNRRWAWRPAIEEAASRVAGEAADQVVRDWIDKHTAEADPNLQWAWRAAIVGACANVNEAAAYEVLRLLGAQYSTAIDADAWDDWRAAMRAVVRHLKPAVVDLAITELVKLHNGSRDIGEKSSLRYVIEEIANRVGEADASIIVERWIVCHEESDNDEQAMQAWCAAINRAARRIGEDKSHQLVTRWLIRHAVAKGEQRAALRSAICSTRLRVPADGVEELVQTMIGQCQNVEHNAAKWQWRGAIFSAACDISGDVAEHVMSKWIVKHNSAKEEIKEFWHEAIAGAATRIKGERATRSIKGWIAQFDGVGPDTRRRDGWQSAMRAAVRAIPASDTAAFLNDLIVEYNVAGDDQLAKDEYMRAIRTLADRVEDNDSAWLIERLLAQYIGCETSKFPWSHAILSVCENMAECRPAVVDSLIAKHHTERAYLGTLTLIPHIVNVVAMAKGPIAVQICNKLIAENMPDIAFWIVVKRPDLAIVHKSETNLKAELATRLAVVLRDFPSFDDGSDFVLDQDLAAAPPNVREALQPFVRSEGLSPAEQFELLLAAMSNPRQPPLFANRYDRSTKQDHFRSDWLKRVREIGTEMGLLDPSRDVRKMNNGQIWLRRFAFEAMLQHDELLAAIIQRLENRT